MTMDNVPRKPLHCMVQTRNFRLLAGAPRGQRQDVVSSSELGTQSIAHELANGQSGAGLFNGTFNGTRIT